ncbi:hypothetical protein BD410DRAFT_182445 [Rickenella mellea]|uniref:Uncharacterized protein n=1 Tax=Rickenella mellea TaxID=50990 RepID=A0A4Y7Q5G6_9AGAM|nr:hypothetical protein BD410DRAFT_182445 [Rickenella mellea]
MNATPPSQSVVSRRRRDGTTLSQHRRQSLSTMCTDTLQLLLSILTSIIDAISSLNTALATTTKHLAKHLLSLLGKLALKALRFTAFSLYKTCVVTKPYVCMAYNAFVQSRGYRFVRETVCFLVAPFGFLRGCGVGLWTRIPERVPLDVWRDKKCKPGQITVRLRFHDGCYNDGLDPRDYDQPCLIDYFTPEKNGELDLRRVAKRFGVEKITVRVQPPFGWELTVLGCRFWTWRGSRSSSPLIPEGYPHWLLPCFRRGLDISRRQNT